MSMGGTADAAGMGKALGMGGGGLMGLGGTQWNPARAGGQGGSAVQQSPIFQQLLQQPPQAGSDQGFRMGQSMTDAYPSGGYSSAGSALSGSAGASDDEKKRALSMLFKGF